MNNADVFIAIASRIAAAAAIASHDAALAAKAHPGDPSAKAKADVALAVYRKAVDDFDGLKADIEASRIFDADVEAAQTTHAAALAALAAKAAR